MLKGKPSFKTAAKLADGTVQSMPFLTLKRRFVMSRVGILLPIATLSLVILMSTGCGNGNRELKSITVTPDAADAQKFSGGLVQFSAVGNYDEPPTPAALTSVSWCASPGPGVCVGINVKPGVTIDQNGLARCEAGSAGTWTINASSPPTQASSPGGEIGANIVFGSATFTCP